MSNSLDTYVVLLKMEGFKSFAKKTEIPFYKGFNAIIGPNGSGKSNIVDAFAFVLGSSSRVMRAHRLDHVIYSGRKAKVDYAEVEIHFDNTSRIFPYDKDYVSVSRRVNKNGSTYYKINGAVVPKSKVIELFSKAGIKPSAYNIIQQGDVVNLIKMKPVERRKIIEQVADLEEYNKKKEKALLELEQAEENIKEAKIVLGEKKIYLDRLKEERDLALKVKELEQKKEKLYAQLYHSRKHIIEKELASIEEQIKSLGDELEVLNKDIEIYDGQISKLEEELKSLEDMLLKGLEDPSLKELNTVLQKIYERESKIKEFEQKISSYKEMISKIDKMISSLQETSSSNLVDFLRNNGVNVKGYFKDLISYDPKFDLAIDVAMGNNANAIVVDNSDDAVKAISLMKMHNLGRAKFIPLDRVERFVPSTRAITYKTMPGVIGFAKDLVSFSKEIDRAVDAVFKDTLIVETVEDAKSLKGVRVVTLEGDLFEAGGFIIGGSYKPKKQISQINSLKKEIEQYNSKIEDAQNQIAMLEEELKDLYELSEALKKKHSTTSIDVEGLKQKRELLVKDLDEVRSKRRSTYERKLLLENKLNSLKLRKARYDVEHENLLKEYSQYERDEQESLEVGDPLKIEMQIKKINEALRQIGIVNMKAIEDYEEFKKEYETYENKLNKLLQEKQSILDFIDEIEQKRRQRFMDAFDHINEKFGEIFRLLGEGDAKIMLEDPKNIDSGLIILAQPKGKKLQNLDALSGGEKTLVSLAFLFAIQSYRKSAFYLLDEVDAALDKINAEKIGNLIKNYSKDNQFIVISHNDITIQKADRIYGVTMQDTISNIFTVKLDENKKLVKEKV